MTNQDQTATASDDLPSSSGDTNNRQPKSPLHTAVTTPRGKYDALFGGEMNSARDRLREYERALRKAVGDAVRDDNDEAFGNLMEEWFWIREAIEKMADAAGTWARWQFPQMSPLARHNAEKWIAANPWYDPRGEDEDSKRVLEIDRQLAQEGIDPEQQAYWQELDLRVKATFPGTRWRQ
jgi:hypothetical protein